jgi:hypothetical protein
MHKCQGCSAGLPEVAGFHVDECGCPVMPCTRGVSQKKPVGLLAGLLRMLAK